MPRSFEDELAALEAQSLRRRLREFTSREADTLLYGGKALHDFSSNDYLGLANEPFLREAATRAVAEHGFGSGASRLVSGTRSPHVRLEERLAAFKGAEAALTFSSGYAAAVGTLGAIAGKGDVLVVDKLIHASLVDGARLCGATLRVFPHNDLDRLEHLLGWARREAPEGRVIVVTESVFSMDGDRAPLAEIVALKERYGAMLMLDEAHAIGVIGANGRGLAERLGLAGKVEIQLGTLSKALGGSGGYVCGSRALVELLLNRARAFVYSTAPPPLLAAVALAAVEFLDSAEGEARRLALWENLRTFAAAVRPGATPAKLSSAIIPVVLGEEGAALAASKRLYEAGFFVPAIRYPTVARGAARLRVTLTAAHRPETLRALAAAL